MSEYRVGDDIEVPLLRYEGGRTTDRGIIRGKVIGFSADGEPLIEVRGVARQLTAAEVEALRIRPGEGERA